MPPADRGLSLQSRKSFTVEEPEEFASATLTVRADDGVVVFLNGEEIGRANLPSGALSASTYATAAPSTSQATKTRAFSIPVDLLRQGENVISASTHLNWHATPGVSFDATLVADKAEAARPSCGAQGYLAPTCGALWGAYTTRGANLTSAVTDLESKVGRQFDLTLRYHDFSTHVHQGLFPDADERALGQSRTPVLAWQARVASTNTDIRWADIARGSWDKIIDDAASRLKSYGKPVMIAFDPEFDRLDKGSMADYVAAFKRVHQRFEANGTTNVAWLWVSTGYLGAGNDAKILAGYPGDQYVDWVGFDPYNFFTCNGSRWNSFEQEVAGPHDFLVNSGFGSKPQILMEYGTEFDENDPRASAAWYESIPSVLKKYPNIKALIRFDANSVSSTCNVSIENGSGMLSAFASAGADPWLNTK
ncbi:hypothetical protein CW368_09250 [Actinomycetales bacterium SN12]|nr:hypothetical protein CW368_09250 [Actinomycetales bacterium SN12]